MPCAACFAARAVAKRSKSEELQPESPQGDLIAAKRSSDGSNNVPEPSPPVYVADEADSIIQYHLMHANDDDDKTRRKRSKPDTNGNLSIIGLSLLGALPVAAVQGVVAWMSRMVSGAGWDSDPSSPGHYFFSPYDWGMGAQCPEQLQDQGYGVVVDFFFYMYYVHACMIDME